MKTHTSNVAIGASPLSDCAANIYNMHGHALGTVYYRKPQEKACAVETSQEFALGIHANAILPSDELRRLKIAPHTPISLEG